MIADFSIPDRFEHGTRARYNAGKCRCTPCRKANTRYESDRQRRVRDGDVRTIVSTAAARAHLLELELAGIGLRSVSAACDVPRSILFGIRRGTRPHLRADTERKILSVDVGARADGALVSARPTWKLLREMIGDGYPKSHIAKKLGRKSPALTIGHDTVTARNELRVRKLHAELLAKHVEEPAVTDETPRARILRAIRFFDWVGAEDLFDGMEVPREERAKYATGISRLARSGKLDRRGVGEFEYRLAVRA